MAAELGSNESSSCTDVPASESIHGNATSDARDSIPAEASPTGSNSEDELENEQLSVRVVVGTSRMAADDATLAKRISDVANRANGHQRFSVGEVKGRLAKGDAEPNANRVLHLAFLGGDVVGCCSSTVQTGWTASGCGHWGALAVDPSAQGQGVASALVDAAEERLLSHGCSRVQIEYHYYAGDPESERLRTWYEGRLGFSGSGAGWRCCTKRLSAPAIKERRRKRTSTSEASPSSGDHPKHRSYSQSGLQNQGNATKRSQDADTKEIIQKPPTCRCTLM